MTSSNPLSPPRLILASGSRYRRNLLERLGLPFEVMMPNVDEAPAAGEDAERTARRLAEHKARAVALKTGGRGLIIGSDQVAVVEGIRLGKPGSRVAAFRQLQTMRGQRTMFHTAVCLLNPDSGSLQTASVPTSVILRDLTDVQIDRYLAVDQPYDCAGSARIECLGIALAAQVESSDPTALIGLPLIALVTMLANEGVVIP